MNTADLEQLSDAELERVYDQHMKRVHRQPRPGEIPFEGLDHAGMVPREELGRSERRAFLGVLPRKSMWPELEEHDIRVAELQARQGEVEGRLRDLLDQRADAPVRRRSGGG